MRTPWAVFLAIVLGSGCLSDGGPVDTAVLNDLGLGGPFKAILVAADRAGAEPSLEFTPGGSAIICSPRGVTLGTDVWVGPGGGASFQAAGTAIAGPPLRSGGGDLGGGDCDLAVDESGRLYLVDLWGSSVSVSWSDDDGATWKGVPASHLPHLLDRPWALGGRAGELFITSAWLQGTGTYDEDYLLPTTPGGIWVIRSLDGGISFPQQVLVVPNDGRIGLNGNLATDGERLFLVYTELVGKNELELRVARSVDRGVTWSHHAATRQSFDPDACFSPLDVFPVIAADESGALFLAWVLQGGDNRRLDLYFQSSPNGGETWNPVVRLTDREGTRRVPWVEAFGSGRVGVAWYEMNDTARYEVREERLVFGDSCPMSIPKDAAWAIRYAESWDAADRNPSFRETLVQADLVTVGGYPGGGEVLQVAFLPDGRAAIAYVSDRPEGPNRPMFAIQKVGSEAGRDSGKGAPPEPRPGILPRVPWVT